MTGIEPNHGYANYSVDQYGLNVKKGFIQDAIIETNSFDLITIWHVLEHTEDPYLVLKRLHALLRPAGKLVIEVPNIEAVCQSPLSTFHEAHLYHFNAQSLNWLAEKASFRTVSVELSPDGGNITLILESTDSPGDSTITDGEENYHRILDIVKDRSQIKHFTKPSTYLRIIRRISSGLREKRYVKALSEGHHILDSLYVDLSAEHQREPSHIEGEHSNNRTGNARSSG